MMKEFFHRLFDRYCTKNLSRQDWRFRLASRLEFLLRRGSSKWRYGVIEKKDFNLPTRIIPRREKRRRIPKPLRRIRTAQGDWSGNY